MCDTSPYINMISRETSFPLVEYDFEDIKLNFPKDIKQMLTFVTCSFRRKKSAKIIILIVWTLEMGIYNGYSDFFYRQKNDYI